MGSLLLPFLSGQFFLIEKVAWSWSSNRFLFHTQLRLLVEMFSLVNTDSNEFPSHDRFPAQLSSMNFLTIFNFIFLFFIAVNGLIKVYRESKTKKIKNNDKTSQFYFEAFSQRRHPLRFIFFHFQIDFSFYNYIFYQHFININLSFSVSWVVTISPLI